MKYSFEKLLEYVRIDRNFHVDRYVQNKIRLLKIFLESNDLNTIVLPVSGGVDSAVVLALLTRAKNEIGKLLKVVPIFMPIHGDGITGQDEARSRAKEVIEQQGYEFYELDLTGVYHEMVKAVKPFTHGIKTIPSDSSGVLSSWTKGQMACILRTPMNYFVAAILQQANYRSLVCGTTNRDEGSYIGFFGKASDAMVDLQLIGDIHKSEVYQLAEYFQIPQSIINEKPKGDVWDKRNDEQMIGAPYWFLELYLRLIEMNKTHFSYDLNEEEKSLYGLYQSNIEQLHRVNSHKYQVGNPAHFIDVMPRIIDGGWQLKN